MKQRVVFIANIGTSDIEEFLEKKGKGKNFFNDTKTYWMKNNFNITPTILDKKISYLQKKYSLAGSKIFLCTTLQEPTPHESDTYYAGQLLKKRLERMFNIQEDTIELFKFRFNPTDFVKLREWYKKEILEVAKVFLQKGYKLVIGITGGTPQQNFALFFSSAIECPLNLDKVLYLKKGDNEPVSIPNIFHEVFLKKHAELLAKNKLYFSAFKLIDRFGFLSEREKYKLSALNLFQNFAFPDFEKFVSKKPYLRREVEEELQVLEQYKKFSNLRDIVRKTGDLDKVKDQGYYLLYLSALERILEDARRKWEQGEYIDFLGRLMRIREGLLKFVIEWKDKVPVSFNYSELNISPKIKEWVRKYLPEKNREDKFYGPREDDFMRRINSGLNEDEVIKRVSEFVKGTKALKKLRNRLILTHEFEGVSETLILEKANYRSIEELFSEVETCIELLKKKLGES